MATRMNSQLASLRAEEQRLESKAAELQSSLNLVQGELCGIRRAISILTGNVEQPPQDITEVSTSVERRPRGSVKDIVLGLLDDRRSDGLKTVDVVDLARARGITLDRNSVASLLSRLSREGTLEYVANSRRYKVKQTTSSALLTRLGDFAKPAA